VRLEVVLILSDNHRLSLPGPTDCIWAEHNLQ